MRTVQSFMGNDSTPYNHLVVFKARSKLRFDTQKLSVWLKTEHNITAHIEFVQHILPEYEYRFTVPSGTNPEGVANLILPLETEIKEAQRQEELLAMLEG